MVMQIESLACKELNVLRVLNVLRTLDSLMSLRILDPLNFLALNLFVRFT